MKTRRHTFPVIDVKKYGGRQIAVAGGKIVASGRTLSEVVARARRKAPACSLGDIHIFSVPKTLAVIYHVR